MNPERGLENPRLELNIDSKTILPGETGSPFVPGVSRRTFLKGVASFISAGLLDQSRLSQLLPVEEQDLEPAADTPEVLVASINPDGGGGVSNPAEVLPNTPEIEMLPLEVMHLANRDYPHAEEYNGRYFKDERSGSMVVLSQKMFDQLASESFGGKGDPTVEGMAEILKLGDWSDIFSRLSGSSAEETWFLQEEGAYIFHRTKTPKSNTIIFFSVDGSRKEISYQTTNPFYKPQLAWCSDKAKSFEGLVGTDGYRATHYYNGAVSEWFEFDQYPVFGTAEQRMKKSLLDFLGENNTDSGGKQINPLDLNLEEVGLYLRTGKTEGFKSFKILPNAKGEPTIILVTGGKYGLRTDLRNIQSIETAVKRINEVDPDAIELLVQQYGLRAISFEVAPGVTFVNYPGYGSTFDRILGIINFNEKTQSYFTPISSIARILGESRDIYNSHHSEYDGTRWNFTLKNRLNANEGIDKSIWLKNWAETNKGKLSREEYENLLNFANNAINLYSAS